MRKGAAYRLLSPEKGFEEKREFEMDDLAKNHEKMLVEESGIDQEVAEARGYRTKKKKMELKGVGSRSWDLVGHE